MYIVYIGNIFYIFINILLHLQNHFIRSLNFLFLLGLSRQMLTQNNWASFNSGFFVEIIRRHDTGRRYGSRNKK